MRVLISGAGIAGPSLAFWLSKTGQKVTIVEKASSLLSIGQNVDVHGSTILILKKMGLLDEVKKLNTTEEGTQLVNEEGGIVAAFPVKGGSSPTSEYEILRGDLSKLLYDSSKDLEGVEYRFNSTIEAVLSNDEKAVTVKFSDGSEDSFDVLVAADGQWSRLRKMCFPENSVRIKDFNIFASYWTAPKTPRDNSWGNIHIALGRRATGIRPDPHGSIRAMFTKMPRDRAEKAKWDKVSRSDKESQKALLKEEFADVGWETKRLLGSLDSASDYYFQAVQQIRMKKWSNGRIICLGDTAYAPTPFTGMGTSLAITGAYLLAQELKKLDPSEPPSVAFDQYENVFRPFVEKIQKVPWIFPGIVHPTDAWQRWILWSVISTISRVIKVVSSITWLKSKSKTRETEDDGVFKLPDYGDDGGLKMTERIEN